MYIGWDEQDLLGWLEDRERQNGGVPIGSPKPAAPSPDSAGSLPKHQEAAEVNALRTHALLRSTLLSDCIPTT